MMRRASLMAVALAIASISASAYEPLDFQSADIAHIGIYIEDLSTGKVTHSYNATKVLIPASVMKSVTAASVQTLIPASFKFTTKVYPTGTIENRILHGDLIVEGSGDPTLGSRFFSEIQPDFINSVVRHVKKLGIDSIAGDIIMDESCLSSTGVSPYWLQEDFAWEYGAGLFGINFRDNSFSMSLTAGVEPNVSDIDIEVDNQTQKTGSEEVTAMRGYDSSVLTITGSVAKTYASRYSMPSPASELYATLIKALSAARIPVGSNIINSDSAPDKTKSLDYTSPSRDQILKVMMHKSDNLFLKECCIPYQDRQNRP